MEKLILVSFQGLIQFNLLLPRQAIQSFIKIKKEVEYSVIWEAPPIQIFTTRNSVDSQKCESFYVHCLEVC